MTVEYRTHRGLRVIAIGGGRLTSLRDWLAAIDAGAGRARRRDGTALLLDFRGEGFTPGAREARAVIELLLSLCGDRVPPLAILTDPGPQFGGARMLCSLGELRACRAAAFRDEDDAWRWLEGMTRVRAERTFESAPVVLEA